MDSPFTILIPVHNEAENIAALHEEIARELAGRDFRVVVVDDGSTDATAAELARHAPDWTVVSTPRVGKSRALEIGLEKVDTDRVVMMDGDLQDDTSAIPALLAEIDYGADCAVGCRARRRDGWLVKKFPSFFFNLFLSLLFGFRFLDINTGLKAFRTDSLRRIHWFENCHRFFPLLVFRLGGRVAHLSTAHRPRVAGTAKFNSPLRFLGGFAQGLALWAGWRDPMPRSARLARLAPVVVALLCGATFFHWAERDWYFADYDSAAFVPHMVRHAADGELINTFQPSARQWDPAGVGRQVGHGFLPSIAVGSLAPEATYRSIHYTLAAIATIGLLFLARLLGRLAPVRPPGSWTTAVLQSLVVLSAAYFAHTREGRPEVFVFALMAVALWFFLSFSILGRLIVAGLTLGALAVTSPIAALLAGLAFLCWLAAALPGRATGRAWCIAALVTLAGLTAWFALYPYPIADWVRGHLTHAEAAIVNYPATNLLDWFINPLKGLGGLHFALSCIVALGLLWTRRHRLLQRHSLLALAAALGLVIWYFGLRLGFTTYNLEWAIPFGLGLVLAVWWRMRPAPGRALVALALAALLAPAAIAFAANNSSARNAFATAPLPPKCEPC